MREIVIASACRTPMGKFQGGLSGIKASELGAIAIEEALKRAGAKPEQVDEVIMGNVLQAGSGQNPARQAARSAHIPDTVGAYTINKVCGSGLKAVMLAAQAIKAEDADLIVAGGMENMTQAPYLLRKGRDGLRMGHGKIEDSMVADGLWDVYNDFHMGSTAELAAREHQISREMQDEYAVMSQKKACKAQAEGAFQQEIVPVEVVSRKGSTWVEQDEGIRAEADLTSLQKLKPAFEKEGSVTAGNASTINDGASALVMTHREHANKLGLQIMASIEGYSTGGMAPEWVMMAPVDAIQKLTQQTRTDLQDIELFEINEAFAAASCAIGQELALDMSKVNVHGGAIALGHPIGASGARILTTLLYALNRHQKTTGLAGLCLGGGNAVAILVKREQT